MGQRSSPETFVSLKTVTIFLQACLKSVVFYGRKAATTHKLLCIFLFLSVKRPLSTNLKLLVLNMQCFLWREHRKCKHCHYYDATECRSPASSRSFLCWDVAQRGLVVGYRRFGTTCRSHLLDQLHTAQDHKRVKHIKYTEKHAPAFRLK